MATTIKKHRRRRYAAPIGGLFVVLVIIGAVSVISGSIQLTGRVLDNSSTKAQIEDIIRPVVMFDPVPFETPQDVQPRQMLTFCMWANLASERRATYTYDENGELQIPASDLDVAAATLFGSEVELEHATFGDYNVTYHYDADRNMYLVPVMGDIYPYKPQVDTIERMEGDLYNVTVGYIPPENAWTIDFSGENRQPSPDKYMVYVMRKVKGGYQIVALRDLETDLQLPNTNTLAQS